jgi:hypothetical protein
MGGVRGEDGVSQAKSRHQFHKGTSSHYFRYEVGRWVVRLAEKVLAEGEEVSYEDEEHFHNGEVQGAHLGHTNEKSGCVVVWNEYFQAQGSNEKRSSTHQEVERKWHSWKDVRLSVAKANEQTPSDDADGNILQVERTVELLHFHLLD